jgi:hypothetical protein
MQSLVMLVDIIVKKKMDPIILLPYQFAAVYSVSVSATGTCDQPPIYDKGISNNINPKAICIKLHK